MEQKHFTVTGESIDITSKNIDKCLELLEKDSTNDEVVGIIYKTNNSDKFLFAPWNREVNPMNVNKIRKSMEENGNLLMPICINEKYEVIDGQTRLSAEKDLGLPIYYYIAEGLGRNECITLNKNQTNWKLMDYIRSYERNGNQSYSLLVNSWNKIDKVIPIETFALILKGRYESRSGGQSGASKKSMVNVLKSGEFRLTDNEVYEKWPVVEYCLMFTPIITRIGGPVSAWYQALNWAYEDKEVDAQRLYRKVEERQSYIYKPADIKSVLEQLNDVYNHGLRIKISIPTNRLNYLAKAKV